MIKFSKRIMKESKCSVCGYPVMADEHNNGEDACPNCGWLQDGTAVRIPNQVFLANMVSLNKARKLYEEGKPLLPDFEDFIEFCDNFNEVEFSYDNALYLVAKDYNQSFKLYDCTNKPALIGEYRNCDDFAANASIGNCRLEDLWSYIRNFTWVD